MRMLRRLELNNLAANICEEHWPEDFFVREVGCSQPAAGFHVDNVLSKRTVLHFLFKGQGAYNGVSLSAGQGFLIAAGEPYSFRVFEEGDWRQYWIALGGAHVNEVLSGFGFKTRNHVFDCPGVMGLEDAFERMVFGAGEGEYPPCRMLSFFYHVMARHCALSPPVRPERDIRRRYADLAARFIEENYYRDIGVEDAAAAAGISAKYLYKVFREKRGLSPSDYLIAVRLKRGRALLHRTDLPVEEVARSVGYNQPGYFSSAFRRFFGRTPLQERASNQQEET